MSASAIIPSISSVNIIEHIVSRGSGGRVCSINNHPIARSVDLSASKIFQDHKEKILNFFVESNGSLEPIPFKTVTKENGRTVCRYRVEVYGEHAKGINDWIAEKESSIASIEQEWKSWGSAAKWLNIAGIVGSLASFVFILIARVGLLTTGWYVALPISIITVIVWLVKSYSEYREDLASKKGESVYREEQNFCMNLNKHYCALQGILNDALDSEFGVSALLEAIKNNCFDNKDPKDDAILDLITDKIRTTGNIEHYFVKDNSSAKPKPAQDLIELFTEEQREKISDYESKICALKSRIDRLRSYQTWAEVALIIVGAVSAIFSAFATSALITSAVYIAIPLWSISTAIWLTRVYLGYEHENINKNGKAVASEQEEKIGEFLKPHLVVQERMQSILNRWQVVLDIRKEIAEEYEKKKESSAGKVFTSVTGEALPQEDIARVFLAGKQAESETRVKLVKLVKVTESQP
ncbi:MAG: hypothetical protein P4L16_07680 [Chlamydiales bacterium]|nr:hypothetical protein [Chlamydiales bacterium]